MPGALLPFQLLGKAYEVLVVTPKYAVIIRPHIEDEDGVPKVTKTSLAGGYAVVSGTYVSTIDIGTICFPATPGISMTGCVKEFNICVEVTVPVALNVSTLR
tara:strand:- start:1217 stop:1522 length:306 start_codon:yes stop_codon:yes gene_type:complete